MVFQELVCVLCVVKVLFAADSAVNGRIEPKYSGIEYNALAALFVKVKVIVHLTVKAAELIVSESVPERDYMVFKLIFYFVYKHFISPPDI